MISPSGNEVGPFLSIEQAALSHVVTDRTRTAVFAWYTPDGIDCDGTRCAGRRHCRRAVADGGEGRPVGSYRGVIVLYALLGVVLAALFSRLSATAEAATLGQKKAFQATFAGLSGLDRSRGVVMKLSGAVRARLVRRRVRRPELCRVLVLPALRRRTRRRSASIFFWANIFAGISALLASRLAARFGLIKTMVGTHLPSNLLLILVPLMPTLPLAIAGPAGPLQHQPDGRADQAVLHHGRRHTGGAIGGRRHHRRRADRSARRSARSSSASCLRGRR